METSSAPTLRQWVKYLIKYSNRADLLRAALTGTAPHELKIRGFRFKGDMNTLAIVLQEIFIDHCYEPAGLAIGQHDTVVDIGANLGAFSVYAAQRTSGRIIALEPFPPNYQILQQNLQANGVTQVTPINAGVGESTGIRKLFLSTESGGHTLYGKNIKGPLAESVNIQLMTLGDVMRQASIEQIDYLKIDCEGAEGEILTSLADELWPKIKKIGMEFHDNVSSLNHEQLVALLTSKGYRAWFDATPDCPFGYVFATRG